MSNRKTQTMDGNTAAAYSSYAFTDMAVIYPITPSSPMAESIDEWAAAGRKNIYGNKVVVKEMQSEGGAAGALHGALQGGALASTYTASQGLLLMIPNMYKVAGELLPAVFHVSARSLASNALSIFGDHQDVMSTRQTGFTLLASSSVQECMDLGAVAHLAAIKSRIPVLHFFDGFRTSHEIQKIEMLEYGELAKLVDMEAVNKFRDNSLNSDHPVLRGTTQNPDIFFQTREAVNKFYKPIPDVVQNYMDEINKLTGRDYKLFNYYGSPKAENIIIAMGSGCDTIRETIEYFNAQGENYGMLEVHLYRPFSTKHMLESIPETVEKIVVLDRTKEPGAPGEPLFLDVKNAFYGKENAPLIVGGIYGLGSKEFTPANVMEVFDNLEKEEPLDGFTVGIVDDVTNKSLPAYEKKVNPSPKGTIACKFWGLGSDGTVSANKSAIKIIGDHTDKYAQAYFAYDSKKSGGLTVSHLRFGDEPIHSPYCINAANYVACHNQSYVYQYDLVSDIKDGGTFLLNTVWNMEELEKELPASIKRKIAEKNVDFYTINAIDIAKKLGLGNRINMIMQSAFFKLSGVMPLEDAVEYLKDAVIKSYGNKGQDVVDMNMSAIEAGINSLVKIDVPDSWKVAVDELKITEGIPEFVKNIMIPMNTQKGDSLPVSAFNGVEDGTYPTGVSQYEKRGIAIDVPYWDVNKCIQCNQCSFVCPHSVLRPMLLTEEQVAAAPEKMEVKDAIGFKGKKFFMGFSALDCTGCGNCVDVCPAKEKALVMKPLSDKKEGLSNQWNYVKDLELDIVEEKQKSTVKGSQFKQPLFEFSGACAGCGETPYAKLVTQLFGDRMVISNSAGCTTVWGGSAPSIPFKKDKKGHGPAWGFSLFEDNAEYGYGMHLGAQTVRNAILDRVKEQLEKGVEKELEEAMQEWVDGFSVSEGTRDRADKLTSVLEQYKNKTELNEIYKRRDSFVKQSNWIFGGDGWAYDIGYGGLDHVLASGENINILVFDTEVYSNTGGQSSKSTPTAAIAKFAASGKRTKKKDLGMMAMSYGYVYVAQVAMGSNQGQTLKAILEAEAYPGPSLIIAYAPCVNHGIKGGMGKSQRQAKRAVESGYWSLYRFNPTLKDQGKNPFILDSKDPTASFEEFLLSEVRYSSLLKQYPDTAKELFEKAENDANERLESYRRLSKQEY
ncbi:pyruvate-ferredoxin/flavodoxin oxidoreductase [Sedimentibacter acidaminivorans]|uniref:Pyruvate-ferredoxin/flavodoxin oxidoreductase n=1 Tax=Sedimentibacter acidaminivorans TaxID=913099 RepID=A0ABS4GFG2_9FIRM|nr:pyruvate:ferredoxin (flavodoxin) oxidoreductase [Sedimentibacter acidaminivorans]MBP1926438.1 pyruvate-ferredoxin/flavodoxin oxidoreductase [Sedimentibacter acidaminivorans]